MRHTHRTRPLPHPAAIEDSKRPPSPHRAANHRRLLVVMTALGLLLAGAAPAYARDPAPQAAVPRQQPTRNANGSYTLRINAQEVVLNCTVLDRKGQLVNGLNKSNFKVFEDKIPQTILSLQHRDTPVSIGLLVDNSGSMRSKRAAVAAAALDLVKVSNPQDETFVVNFSDQAYLDQDFTADLDKLRASLGHSGQTGGTALYDTVVTAADKMEKTAHRSRKVIIIITDGDDNSSTLTLKDAIRRVQDMQGPIIYSIGLLFDEEGGGGEARHARHDLQALSDETGGIAFFPHSTQDIDAVAAEVARDIRNQYTIAYRFTQAGGSGGAYHSVKVEAHAAGHARLTVHTRLGYYSNAHP